MSRSLLSLYRLDRAALQRFSGELEALLAIDDRAGLAALLELDGTRAFPELRDAVHAFLLPPSGAPAAELFEAADRVAKKLALRRVFESDSPALEGRLRAFDALREDGVAAGLVDRLLNPKRLPWYLRRPGRSGGWIAPEMCAELNLRLGSLGALLPPEIRNFARGLEQIDGDAVVLGP